MLVWELAWADSALVAVGKWLSYRGGGISRFDSVMFALNLACNRNKLFKTLDHWSRDMLNFNFLEKGLGVVSPPHFVYDFVHEKNSSHVTFY